jgi:hypothetical protein
MGNWTTYSKYEEESEWKVCVREGDEIIHIEICTSEKEATEYIKSETLKQADNMSTEKDDRKKTVNDTRDLLGDSLDSLLSGDSLEANADTETDLPQITSTTRHDYENIKGVSMTKAKKTITALMKFYLDEDIIENDEYVQARKKIDEMTLSSLMFQLDTAEKALVTLLRTIDSGETAPRMFEVLGTLQKSMLDIIKSQTMYLVAAEESVKKLSRDIEIFTDRKNKKISGGDGKKEISNVNRGTKNLMQEIQGEIKEEGYDTNTDDIEEINPDEID